MPIVSVGRDPFARGEYLRQSESGTGLTCAWCGQVRRTLYRYAWVSDGETGPRFRGLRWSPPFCNARCRHDYQD